MLIIKIREVKGLEFNVFFSKSKITFETRDTPRYQRRAIKGVIVPASQLAAGISSCKDEAAAAGFRRRVRSAPSRPLWLKPRGLHHRGPTLPPISNKCAHSPLPGASLPPSVFSFPFYCRMIVRLLLSCSQLLSSACGR